MFEHACNGICGTTCHPGKSQQVNDWDEDVHWYECTEEGCGERTRQFKNRYFDATGEEI